MMDHNPMLIVSRRGSSSGLAERPSSVSNVERQAGLLEIPVR